MPHSKNVGKGGSKASSLKPVSGSQKIGMSRKQGQGKIVSQCLYLTILEPGAEIEGITNYDTDYMFSPH